MTNQHGVELGDGPPALEARGLSVFRNGRSVLENVSMAVPVRRVVALLGPSGGGKTTLLKSFNRMNDLDPGVDVRGEVLLNGENIYAPRVDPVEVRRRIGMVFQRPNPFPTSVFENVAFGPRVNRFRGDLSLLVEESLRQAALWEEVSDRLFEPASRLSSGQQQRLCIARSLAVRPEVLLMDEPAADLDPSATRQVEELIHRLKEDYTILLVTHNIQHAARVSDYTAFLLGGELVEYGPTSTVFTNPREARTEAFVTGRPS
jgi:phosphate transport system ATP-binding protein